MVHVKQQWLDAEVYLYGKITSLAFTENLIISFFTDDYGVVTFITDKDLIPQEGLRVSQDIVFEAHTACKQNIFSGEIRKYSFRLLSIRPHGVPTEKQEEYLNEKVKLATKAFADVEDVQVWIDEIRGNNHDY